MSFSTLFGQIGSASSRTLNKSPKYLLKVTTSSVALLALAQLAEAQTITVISGQPATFGVAGDVANEDIQIDNGGVATFSPTTPPVTFTDIVNLTNNSTGDGNSIDHGLTLQDGSTVIINGGSGGGTGAFVNTGTVLLESTSSLTASSINNSSPTGAITIQSDSSFESTGDIVNQNGASITFSDSGNLKFNSTGYLNNTGGSITTSGTGGTLTVSGGALNNKDGGTITIGGYDTFSGVTTVVTNEGTATDAATITVGEYATLNVKELQNNDYGTIDNSGTIQTTNGTLNNASGGTITVTSTGTIVDNVVTSGTVNNAGTITGTTDVTAGTVESSGTLTGAATVDVDGTLNVTGGTASTIDNAGTLAISSGAETGAVTNSGTGSNAGTIASLENTDGTFTNTGTITGTTDVTAGTVESSGILTGAATVDVDGTLNVTGGTASTIDNDGALAISAGVSAGAITNSNTASNAGTISSLVNDDGTFDNTGKVTGTTDVTNGTVKNTGSLSDDVSVGANGTLEQLGQVDGNVSNSGNLTLAGMINGDLSNLAESSRLVVTDNSEVTGDVQTIGKFEIKSDLNVGGTFNIKAGVIPATDGTANVTDATLVLGGGGGGNGTTTANSGAKLTATTIVNDSSIGLVSGSSLNGNFINNKLLVAEGATEINGNMVNSANGVIDMRNDSSEDVLSFSGDAKLDGRIYMDLSLAENALDNDLIVVAGDLSGTPIVNFNALGENETNVTDRIDVIRYGGTSSLDPITSGLPTTGAVSYQFKNNAGENAWQLQAGANPAVGGLATGIVLTQSLIGSVVNRPSSPFVTGRALAEEEPCGYGGWTRLNAGHAKVKGDTETSLGKYDSKLTTDYEGFQFGGDYSCFDGRFKGWDMSFGGSIGYNAGNVKQNVYFFNPLTGDLNKDIRTSKNNTFFDQYYGGAYVGFSRAFEGSGQVLFGDVQFRYDQTHFKLKNHPNADALDQVRAFSNDDSINIDDLSFGVENQKYKTKGKMISGSMGYSIPINTAKDLRIVPTAGFQFSNVDVDNLDFTQGVLKTEDIKSRIGFAGVTMSKNYILPSGASAMNLFATTTVYNDFASKVKSDFFQYESDGSLADKGLRSKTSNLETYGELSIGMNYTEVYNQGQFGPPQQIDMSLRGDLRHSDDLDGWSVTLQGRLNF